MNSRGEKPTLREFDCCARQSCGAVSRNGILFLCCGFRCRKSSRNRCTQSIGIHSQFTMGLPHALSHSPDPDSHSGALGLNFCEPFRRHPLPLILNLGINLVGPTNDTDDSSLAS